MKLIKTLGAACFILSGYLISLFGDPDISDTGNIWLGLLTLVLILVGFTAIFATNRKSFGKSIREILSAMPF